MKNLVYDKFGSFGKIIVKNCFNNFEVVEELCLPVVFIHGTDDRMIGSEHSKMLWERMGDGFGVFFEVEGMRHGVRYLKKDFLDPVKDFYRFLNQQGYNPVRF